MNYQLLKGKRGIIFGALDPNSIAWKVAERCHEEGAAFCFIKCTGGSSYGSDKSIG